MTLKVAITLTLAGLALCGCKRAFGYYPDPVDNHGRYSGVGIYGPSQQWTKLMAMQQTKDPQAARLIDDQVIIVVQDSATGEIRACGDLTGYCIGMNPWKTALVSAQLAPIKLTEHKTPDERAATVKPDVKAADDKSSTPQ